MKIRLGFVSNSSSTSFCVLGKSYQIVWDQNLITDYNRNDDYETRVIEDIERCANDAGLESLIPEGAEDVIVGIGPEKLKDNDMFGDFRNRVEEMLAEFEKACQYLKIESTEEFIEDPNIRKDNLRVEWIYGDFNY